MFTLDKNDLIILLTGALMVQSGWALSLALVAKRRKSEVDKYAEMANYFSTILIRENVELEDFDLIALSTIEES